jgi:hypothetical protein
MKQGIQTFLNSIGDTGCLMLCLIKIAEMHTGREIDFLSVIAHALEKKWLQGNMFVEKPNDIMRYMTGEEWSYSHSSTPAVSDRGVYCVERWEWSRPNSILNHFRLKDWDSLDPSPVVSNGKLQSYRIIRKVA